MLVPTVIFILLALVLFVINSKREVHIEGVKNGMLQLIKVLPVILLAFVLAGMIEVLIPEEFVRQWLSREAGLRGVFLGMVGGSLLAMGPYASFPIIASIYGAGAGIGTAVSLITSWCVLGTSRLPYELGFLGVRFAVFRFSLAIPFCLAAGAIAHFIEIMVL